MHLTASNNPAAQARQAFCAQLAGLFVADELDAAMDHAARFAQATVSIFAAAPVDCWDESESAAIEFAVEFLVPPPSLDVFHRELEAQLLRQSPRYVAGRYRGDFGPCVIRSIPDGAFHQSRVAWRSTAADQLPEIFERFQRVDGSRSKESGGHGLGLAIVKSIAVLHGGSAQITSEVGVGTSITLQFLTATDS